VIWDCVMLRDELDMLEMRLTEFQDVPGLMHVVAEADVDFQGHPKPLWFGDHLERFAPWKDRILHIAATNLPDSDDPWVRENAQRNACAAALQQHGAAPDDVVLVGDVDEIPPTPLPPLGGAGWAMEVRHMTFAVDWENPVRQVCTSAVRWKQIRTFARMRELKYWLPRIDAGWHFSWLGGPAAITAKNEACAHLEHKAKVAAGNAAGRLYEQGWCPWMGDGVQLAPVEVDETWPRWIRERRCPPEWFRPRQKHGEAA